MTDDDHLAHAHAIWGGIATSMLFAVGNAIWAIGMPTAGASVSEILAFYQDRSTRISRRGQLEPLSPGGVPVVRRRSSPGTQRTRIGGLSHDCGLRRRHCDYHSWLRCGVTQHGRRSFVLAMDSSALTWHKSCSKSHKTSDRCRALSGWRSSPQVSLQRACVPEPLRGGVATSCWQPQSSCSLRLADATSSPASS